MALIQGADVKIELYLSGAWTDITCDVTSATWTWGAPEALGPLTECEGGPLRVSLYDPDRTYDPDNPASPFQGGLTVGAGMRVTVDGAAAWTGVLQTWAWDRASTIADLNGLDPIGQLGVRVLPQGQTLAAVPAGATTATQAQYLLDLVEWPSAKRYFPNGTAGEVRGNHVVDGPVLDGLHRIRFAELGRVYPMRDGRIGWHSRAGPTPPASSAVINCTGVGLTDMWKAMGLGRVRNHVVVAGGYGVFGPVLPPDEYRSVNTNSEFLQFTYAGAPAALPWDAWAQTIIDALEDPPVLTMLGTILPVGAQVAQVLCAEFGARWTVKVTGEPDTVVQVFGMQVSLAPGTIEVDVVTEDVGPAVPYVHATAQTESGSLSSVNATYATARAGSGVTVAAGPSNFYVGQYIPGANYEINEAFVSFDTSAIPAGATIVEATFAANLIERFVPGGGQSRLPFTVEVRSGYAWRPTLAAADWRPGAGIAAGYTLRASWNTANGLDFREFTDAGLAGAIVKAGITELFIVSARTTAGTAPTANQFEALTVQFPRLRVRYTVP